MTLSMEAPADTPVYQINQAARQYETTIESITAIPELNDGDRYLFAKVDDATHAVAAEQTIFHPQGGGQPSDRGVISALNGEEGTRFEVSLARCSLSSPNIILHGGHYSSDRHNESSLKKGDRVRLAIDSAARDLHSRIHTGGHLISFAVHALRDQIGLVGEGKANHHPGTANVEFIGTIASEHRAIIQSRVDEYIQQDLDVLIKFVTESEAKELSTAVPDVIKSDVNGWVRMMIVNSLGAFPCGGTHLPSTKAVGRVEVGKIGRKKNITKISYSVS